MNNFLNNLKNIKISYFKKQILSLLLMLTIIFGSVFFSFFSAYKKETNLWVVNQRLDYQRKNSFTNNIKTFSSLLSLQVESSLTPSDISNFFINPNYYSYIFDLENHYNQKDQVDLLDLTVSEGLELQYLRNSKYIRKLKRLKKFKTILNFLKENPNLIQLVNDGMFRNFHGILIASSEMATTFVNSLEEMFQEFLPPKNEQLFYTITDITKSFRWTGRLINLIETIIYKTDKIPLKVKQKKIYRILKFINTLNKFFIENKQTYINELKEENVSEDQKKNHKMWERFEGRSDDKHNLLPDTSKEIIISVTDHPSSVSSQKLSYEENGNIWTQLEDDDSFVNKYPELVYRTIKEKLFKNAAKLFLSFVGPLVKDFFKLITNPISTKDRLLDFSESKFQSFVYLFKILIFLLKNEVYETSDFENKNLKEFLKSFLKFFEKMNFDGEEIGFFKKELFTLFKNEKEVPKVIKLKDNFILVLLETKLTDKMLNFLLKLFSKQIENNIKSYAKYFEGLNIYSSKSKSIFDFFKQKMNDKNNGMNKQLDAIDEVLTILKKDKAKISDNDEYVKNLKKLFEKIIDLLIYITESIFNENSKDNISLKWMLNIINVFLQQFNVVSENFGYNILSPIFETISSLGEDQKFLIDTLKFLKEIGGEIFINRLLKIRLLYKDKADWVNQKLSYCYIKSLIRENFNPKTDCVPDKIDLEKPDYVLSDKKKEYKKGSPIEENSPLAKIIDLIQNIDKENNTFGTFRKLIAKIFSFSSNVLEKMYIFMENEYYNYYGFYLDERNWEFNDSDEKWLEYKKALEESKNEYYIYKIIGSLKRNGRIIYSYRFVYEINLKESILKIIELEKLI